jgi:DNA-binding PadR family transcriptional regulator
MSMKLCPTSATSNSWRCSPCWLLRDRARRELAMATVYTTLDRLEQKGLLTSRLGDPTPERGGRRKKYFRVSAAGQRAVKASLAALGALTRGLDRSYQP